MKHSIFNIILISFLLCACGSHELLPSDYVRYVENPNNGLLLNTKVNGVKYTLQYQPTEYMVMLQLRSFSIPAEVFKEQYNRFKGMEHYVFRIDKREMDSLTAKAKDTAMIRKGMIEYLNFKIQKDLKIVENGDTVPCGIAECESNMGMFPYYSFVLGFNVKGYNGTREFIYSNKNIGTGNVEMELQGKNIQNIPKLKMKG